jgi:tetratricopeptide (TPR) repeat protein
MNETLEHEIELSPATDGGIAVINLQSTLQSAWNRFWRAPERPGLAEHIVEQEGLALEFLSDFGALDRLVALARQLAHIDRGAIRTALIQAQVASATHHFADARDHLVQARLLGAPVATVDRLSLGIDQACGTRLDTVLATRRSIAAETRHLEDLVPLGALLADLGQFDEADQAYQAALRDYHDVSAFAMAWVCFQLGALWGELVPEREADRAARWYRKAIEYLPSYVKARVHLAEIYLSCDRAGDAEALLIPAIATGDPEVRWRLADVLTTTGRSAAAEEQLQAARRGFEVLLGKHLLAFADHGAEFYAGSGNDPRRAFELARVNVANRPTLRAFTQAHATAIAAGDLRAASESLAAAETRWGGTAAFRLSPLAVIGSQMEQPRDHRS